jgi:RimJ/RimL family protein N-acetyltransferase
MDNAQRRSQGPLDTATAEKLRRDGVPLAYDPVQIGWVPADAEDDLHLDDCLRPWPGDAAFVLRRWSERDAPRYAALLSDPRIWRFMPERPPEHMTPDLALDLIRLADTAPHHRVRAVLVDGLPVGQVRLLLTPPGAGTGEAEISYWLSPDHWGRGLATGMVRAFTRECLAVLPEVGGIFARVHKDNAASARVLQKAGYAAAGHCPRDADWRVYRQSR